MMRRIAILIFLLTAGARGDEQILLLHINDSHGQTQQDPNFKKPMGGYARLITKVDEIRAAQGDRMILVDCGDVFSRGDEVTVATRGRANLELMNLAGVQIWTPGNGDFYDGYETLKGRMKDGRFDTLAANVFSRSDGRCIAKPYVIRPVGPVKVAFLGLCFIRTQLPSCWGYDLKDPIETARALVPELRKQADVVVAVTHIGIDEDRKLAAVVEGIDVILGAHSHSTLKELVMVRSPDGRKTAIAQAGDHLRYLGQVAVTVRRDSQGRWQVVSTAGKLLPLDETVPQDACVKALIARLVGAARPATKPASMPAIAR